MRIYVTDYTSKQTQNQKLSQKQKNSAVIGTEFLEALTVLAAVTDGMKIAMKLISKNIKQTYGLMALTSTNGEKDTASIILSNHHQFKSLSLPMKKFAVAKSLLKI